MTMLKNPYKHIPSAVWLMVMVTFISRSGSMVFVFLPLYLVHQLHFSVTTVGLILSFYGLGEIIGSYIGGKLADKFGFVMTQSIALVLAGVGYMSLPLFSLKFILSSILFLIGFLNASVRPATGIIIAEFSTPETRSKGFALNYQAVNLGATIGPAIGGILAAINYHSLFYVDGLMNMIAGICLVIFFHKKPTPEAHTHAENITISPWKDKKFLRFLFIILLIGLCFFTILNTYPYFLKNNYDLSTKQIGFIMAINGLLITLFQMQVIELFDSIPKIKAICIGGFCIIVGFFILPFYSGFYYALLSMSIITLGEMISVPLAFDYVSQLAPNKSRGVYLGLTSCCQASIPLTLTPLISMYIYNEFGPTTLWLSMGLIGIIFIKILMTREETI